MSQSTTNAQRERFGDIPALYLRIVDNLTRETLRARLAAARSQTDRLFDILAPSSFYERPIVERHRIIFYLGHLEAFDKNMIHGPIASELDGLFARGIDPVDGQLPDDRPADWPSLETVRSYNRTARSAVDESLTRATDALMFHVGIEHRLMHAETLAYMFHWLPYESKQRTKSDESLVTSDAISNRPQSVRIPAGHATLGKRFDDPFTFGWDNEFESHSVSVPEFAIDVLNVTNGDFLDFARAGGYSERSFWSDEGWEWIQSSGIQHPKFWIRRGANWFYRTMFDEIPLPVTWPVFVSHAEAQAYARWKGRELPTEAQFHRAAFGSPHGSERNYPWGEESPGPQHGNFDFRSWMPMPVGSFPAGRSAFGVFDLVGNGWEWTRTEFAPFEGFRAFPFYPGYSADFFDGKHFVMKGASQRTAAVLLRRSFRNWFQPYYPNIYATFRCVEN
jgi:gamma-glutamyl hercynylcysteine S-oxide synthase